MADRVIPFGKYFLLDRINVGGMAEVYKAKTVGVEGFEKVVAIKRILPSVAEDEDFIKMFVDEAKITSQLSHANLAQTFDLGKIGDAYYIAMEYVPGKDLRAVFERLKRKGDRMPLPLAAYVIGRVCEGLDYAHRKRDASGRELHIVHRDVSPQNIILSYEGEVKLIDFGIAKAANKMTKTQAGILKGKFGYMSPEQVRGLPLDGRSDIFAAGVVLYELCTGERLFTGASDFSVLEKVQQARVTPPSQVDPKIPLKFERIMLKALTREPADRYQHAGDLAADLQRFLLDTQPRATTRDDVTAFMRGAFPDEAEQKGAEARPRRRPPPAIDRGGEKKRAPPPLPASLTQGLGETVVGEDDPERTITGPTPEGPRAEIIVRSRLEKPDAAEPGDGPTRPMSMNELASAERAYAQREKLPQPTVVLGEDTPTPKGPPGRPTPPPVAPPRIEDQKTQVRPTPPFEGRMAVNKPTLIGDDPAAAEESTNSGVRRRAQWMRRAQYAIVVTALAIAAWAVLSTPKPRTPKVAAEGATALPRGEQKTVTIALEASENEVTVLSSPPGAQVYVDGVKKATTPAFLSLADSGTGHAISVEKKCYRSWQVALPARAGRRQLAASLEPAAGACPGTHLEQSGMPAPGDLPEEAAASATLGFLNLGSRPAALVLIDGVDIGQRTPLVAWPLRNGRHQLRLVGGGRSKEVAVEIRTGETHSEIVDLQAAATAKKRGRR